MYSLFLFLHSFIRWLVLAGLIYSLFKGIYGWKNKGHFTSSDRIARQVTASIVHVQFLVGVILYLFSPLTIYFRAHTSEAMNHSDLVFFGITHVVLMLAAVVVITIGSIKSKRAIKDVKKFSSMTIYYAIGFLIILISIPWPISPFSERPLFRFF